MTKEEFKYTVSVIFSTTDRSHYIAKVGLNSRIHLKLCAIKLIPIIISMLINENNNYL